MQHIQQLLGFAFRIRNWGRDTVERNPRVRTGVQLHFGEVGLVLGEIDELFDRVFNRLAALSKT